MLQAYELTLMTGDALTERQVRDTLEQDVARSTQLVSVQSREELAERARSSAAGMLLVDIAPNPSELLSYLGGLQIASDHVSLVVICDELRTDVVLEAMQVGARHCIVRSDLSAELPAVIGRLAASALPMNGHGGGEIVTVLSARGGCGGTTLAINLADEVRLEGEGDVLLIDLDCCYGAMATYLGVESSYGVADVFSQRGTIDPQLIRSTSVPTADGLHLLASPASIDFSNAAAVPFDNLAGVLAAAKHAFDFTVIDAPRVSMDVAATLAQHSVATFIVFEPAVVDVRTARHMVTALTDRGVPQDKLRPLANRYHKRNSMVNLADVTEALGGIPLAHLPNDFSSATRSLNFGKPLSSVAPRSSLRKNLRDLAHTVGVRTNGNGSNGSSNGHHR